ncbi:hypothetical protein ACFL1B_00630 [Nanoarchaeota archaeon]
MLSHLARLEAKHQIIFAILIAFAVISIWRGLWGMWDFYIYPNNYELSLWISFVVGLVILLLTGYATKELI